ncbi:MAG: stage 0 sporulation family protein [Syntrophales bacterium]
MRNIVGVQIRRSSKICHFDSADIPAHKNDHVIVETESGPAFGLVVTEIHSTPADRIPPCMRKVKRLASEEDSTVQDSNEELEKEAQEYCQQKIVERNLPMKLVDVECLFDKSKVIFFFTAENRVDFRELVKDLVQKFRSRIELRQIGARQETRILRGMGICGREICCATMLHDLDRVSVKMAKEQNMSLNPEKISGLCGRLMCCLAFEHGVYTDLKKNMPKCGKVIQTDQGAGKVMRQNILDEEIDVQLEDGREITLNLHDISSPPKK